MLADELDYVVGVDTHRDEHVVAVLAAPAGAVIAKLAVRANARGYQEALDFAEQYAHGARVWAVEGTGHYGAGRARFLGDHGEPVLEVSRQPRGERRLRGKTTRSTRSGRRERRSRARRSRGRARVSGAKRCACC
jgi:transposase